MLALVLVLGGAVASSLFAFGSIGTAQLIPAVVATLVQVAVAIALQLNVPGARVVASIVLLIQLLLIELLALVFMALAALPLEGGGPIVGHDFNPVWFVVTLTAMVAAIAVYLLAIRALWQGKRVPASAT